MVNVALPLASTLSTMVSTLLAVAAVTASGVPSVLDVGVSVARRMMTV